MSYIDKLTALNLPADTAVILSYSDGCDVSFRDETEVHDAARETDVISRTAELILELAGEEQEHPLLDDLREWGVIEDFYFDPDDDEADPPDPLSADELTDLMTDNVYEVGFIEHSIRRYDYKRGHCTLSSTIESTIGELLEVQPNLSGWSLEVETAGGTLTIEA